MSAAAAADVLPVATEPPKYFQEGASPVPAGGCVGESQRLLRRGAPDSASKDIAEPMAMRSWEQSAGDSRVQEVFARWSECMERAGFATGRRSSQLETGNCSWRAW